MCCASCSPRSCQQSCIASRSESLAERQAIDLLHVMAVSNHQTAPCRGSCRSADSMPYAQRCYGDSRCPISAAIMTQARQQLQLPHTKGHALELTLSCLQRCHGAQDPGGAAGAPSAQSTCWSTCGARSAFTRSISPKCTSRQLARTSRGACSPLSCLQRRHGARVPGGAAGAPSAQSICWTACGACCRPRSTGALPCMRECLCSCCVTAGWRLQREQAAAGPES